MNRGVFFAVVGASGVGKDTVLGGARDRLAGNTAFAFPQRYITRPEDAGGENHLALSEPDFQQMLDSGGFCLSWSAHRLHYGLSRHITADLRNGTHLVCNISRTSIAEAKSVFDRLEIIEITADRATIAARLRSRGRESAADVTARQARQVADWRAGHDVHTIRNDGAAQDAITAMTGLLLRLSAQSVQPA